MTEISDTQIRHIFDQYSKNDVIELWRLPDILLTLNIMMSEEEIYNLLAQLDIKNNITFAQLNHIIVKIQNKTTNEVDDDITEAWIVLKGKEDKSGYIKVQDLQQMCDEMNMKLRFEQILKAYYRNKNITQYNLQDISYQTFKDIFTAFQDIID